VIVQYEFKQFQWLDVQKPTKDELMLLQTNYGIDSQIINDLIQPLSDTRVTQISDQIYFTFHTVTSLSLNSQPSWYELDVIITDQTIITVIYEPLNAINELRDELEIETSLNRQKKITSADFLGGLMMKVHQDLRNLLAVINSEQQKIDERIFGGSERAMVRSISNIGRNLFRLNQTIAEQRHVLKFFPTTDQPLEKFLHFWDRELDHTTDQTSAQYQLYHDLRKTNEELLATKQNEVMRKLTLVAFITSPLTILAGIFGMNTQSVPFVGSANDFWVVLGIMAAVVVITVVILNIKGWFE
jgi:magnesium transporter